MIQNEKQDKPLVWRWILALGRTLRFFFASIGAFALGVPLFLGYSLMKGGGEWNFGGQGQTKAPLSQGPHMLKLQLSGVLNEARPNDFNAIYRSLIGQEIGTYVPNVLKLLEQAEKDEKIAGLFMHIGGLQGSLAQIDEIRKALVRFKAGGKKLSIHLDSADNTSYFLASVADQIAISPTGSLEIPGPILQQFYVRSALEKLGVEFQVFRAGKYKSVFENFVRDEPSPEAQQMSEGVEADLRKQLIIAIAEGRKKPPEEVQAWLRHGLFSATEAQKKGIIDRICYQKVCETEALTEYKIESSVDSLRYSPPEPKTQIRPRPKIAVIDAAGEIYMNGAGSQADQVLTPRRLAKALKWAREDDDIKAIVLKIASPGGVALAAELMWADIVETRNKKPVVASMSSVAASGGYYIAAPAHRIYADHFTITGSIGVIGGIPKWVGSQEKWGVNFHTITGSDRAALYTINKKASDADVQVMNEHIAETYRIFLERVAEGRKISTARVDELAQGKIYTGSQALAFGLIDELGGLREAIFGAAKLAEIEPDPDAFEIKYYMEQMDFFECMKRVNDIQRCAMGTADLDSPEDKIKAKLRGLVTMTLEDRRLMITPFSMGSLQ